MTMTRSHVSHYARALTARHDRPPHVVAELDAMAAWIESHYPVIVRHLPAPMLRRLVEIEAMPVAPMYADLESHPRPASELDPSPPAAGSEPGEAAHTTAPPPAPPSSVRAILPVDQWATATHAWQCGCTHPSAGQCEKCAGSCLCHVGATAAGEQREVARG